MMRKISFAVIIFLAIACNSQPKTESMAKANSLAEENSAVQTKAPVKGGCGSTLVFKEGVVLLSESFDGQGKLMGKHSTTIKKVYNEAGILFSEMEVKNSDANGKNEKTMTSVYKCDGGQIYIDLNNFMANDKQKSKLETSGLSFPYDPSVGDTIADANFSMKTTSSYGERTITSHIKERKVEAKESITTAAGTFECYRISSVVSVDLDMPGMDAEDKRVMENVKKQMGKNKMIFWYAPDIMIIKMEYYMGDKLLTRNEITGIKK